MNVLLAASDKPKATKQKNEVVDADAYDGWVPGTGDDDEDEDLETPRTLKLVHRGEPFAAPSGEDGKRRDPVSQMYLVGECHLLLSQGLKQ